MTDDAVVEATETVIVTLGPITAGDPQITIDTGNDDASANIGDNDNIATWTNPIDALDVNADGHIAPIDALILINSLNSDGSRTLPTLTAPPEHYLDPSGDGHIAPNDVLLIINFLNRFGNNPESIAEQAGTLSGEGEAEGLGSERPGSFAPPKRRAEAFPLAYRTSSAPATMRSIAKNECSALPSRTHASDVGWLELEEALTEIAGDVASAWNTAGS